MRQSGVATATTVATSGFAKKTATNGNGMRYTSHAITLTVAQEVFFMLYNFVFCSFTSCEVFNEIG